MYPPTLDFSVRTTMWRLSNSLNCPWMH